LSEKEPVVSLKTVAERVGLAVCSVSAILNGTPASKAIPQPTQDRVFRAAAELNYRPNLWARSLRTKRTRMIAAITSDIGLAPVARVVAGVQSLLQRRGYLLVLRSLDCSSEDRTSDCDSGSISLQLQQRGIEGVVAIGATLPSELKLPIAVVDFEYITLLEPLADEARIWLSDLGEAAAEAVIQQIERNTTPRRMKIVPRLPNAYFNLAHVPPELGQNDRA
jgi:DNA-binding LacI/PurR family transcriptional regulator